ncbi:MAG: hypothetical protein EOO15_18425, partial [Chitinophagaceae bacterium]
MRTKVQQMLAVMVLMLAGSGLRAQYVLRYIAIDSAASRQVLSTSFPTRADAARYIYALPALLQGKGYVTASIDSSTLGTDSGRVYLYAGTAYRWARLSTAPGDADLFSAVRWNAGSYRNTAIDFNRMHSLQQRLLDHLEDV